MPSQTGFTTFAQSAPMSSKMSFMPSKKPCAMVLMAPTGTPANCTWLPWLLWRLDEGWEREGDIWAQDLTMKPSEYFKRQCFVSVEPDEDGVKYVIDYIGTDRLVFSTDYPHGDSKFPHAVETFLELPISDKDKQKILWDNCAEFYRLGA